MTMKIFYKNYFKAFFKVFEKGFNETGSLGEALKRISVFFSKHKDLVMSQTCT